MMSLLEAISPTSRALLNSTRFKEAVALVAAERQRQKQLLRAGKILFNCDSPIVGEDRKLRILLEEVGELGKALDDLENCKSERSRKSAREDIEAELTQVAAVAVAWLETPSGVASSPAATKEAI